MTGLILLSVLGVGVLLSSLAPEVEDFLPDESTETDETVSTDEAENLLDQFEQDGTISIIRGESGLTHSPPDELAGTEGEDRLESTQVSITQASTATAEDAVAAPEVGAEDAPEEGADAATELASPTDPALAADVSPEAEEEVLADAGTDADEENPDLSELASATAEDDSLPALEGPLETSALADAEAEEAPTEAVADGVNTLIGSDGDDVLIGDQADMGTENDATDIMKVLGLDDSAPKGEDKVTMTDFNPEEDVLIVVDRNGEEVALTEDEGTAEDTTFVGIRPTEDGAGTEVIYDNEVVAVLLGTDVSTLEENAAWLANRNSMALVSYARMQG